MTPAQQRFVDEYLVDLNATQAAIRSGYSPATANQQASRLLAHVKVAAAIRTAIEARGARMQVTQDDVVQELKRIAFSDIRNYVRWNENGVAMEASDTLTPDMAAAVCEVAETSRETTMGERTNTQTSRRFRLHDKVRALELLGKHVGMFGEVNVTEEQRAARIAEILTRGELRLVKSA